MNNALHLAAAFGLVAGGALCFHRFACDTPNTQEPGTRLLPAAVGEYLHGVALSSELQAKSEGSLRRAQAQYEIVTELLAGRFTLLEAAARFRDLDAGLPEVRDRLVQHYPGMPYEVAL